MDEQTPTPPPVELAEDKPKTAPRSNSRGKRNAAPKKRATVAKPKAEPPVIATAPPSPDPQPQAAAPVPKADTIYEPVAYWDDPVLTQYYEIVHADPEKQYYIFNPKTEQNPAHGSNPINMHYLMMRYWRPEQIKVPEGKTLILQYDAGHPEHPAGTTQFVPAGRIVMSRPMRYKRAEESKRSAKDNPGLDPSANQDVHMVMGPNGAMVLDKKSPFTPGSKEVADMLPTREFIRANEERIQSGRDAMPDDFYDALKEEAERALAH